MVVTFVTLGIYYCHAVTDASRQVFPSIMDARVLLNTKRQVGTLTVKKGDFFAVSFFLRVFLLGDFFTFAHRDLCSW